MTTHFAKWNIYKNQNLSLCLSHKQRLVLNTFKHKKPIVTPEDQIITDKEQIDKVTCLNCLKVINRIKKITRKSPTQSNKFTPSPYTKRLKH